LRPDEKRRGFPAAFPHLPHPFVWDGRISPFESLLLSDIISISIIEQNPLKVGFESQYLRDNGRTSRDNPLNVDVEVEIKIYVMEFSKQNKAAIAE
jgi:hypothetical protein